MIKEFQRLKEDKRQQLGWHIRHNLMKINCRIQTDAIRKHLIPLVLDAHQIKGIYASEADLLNMALFGKTAKQWRDENPGRRASREEFGNGNPRLLIV